jgi:regulatory protein
MKHWCAWQERCQSEARRKLYTYGIQGETMEFIIAELIGQGFLSEERFAISYARGKFRIKKWGRIKIRQELRSFNIPEVLISKGLAEISEEDYRQTLRDVIGKKMSGKPGRAAIHTIARYAITRGFEPVMVYQELKMEAEAED